MLVNYAVCNIPYTRVIKNSLVHWLCTDVMRPDCLSNWEHKIALPSMLRFQFWSCFSMPCESAFSLIVLGAKSNCNYGFKCRLGSNYGDLKQWPEVTHTAIRVWAGAMPMWEWGSAQSLLPVTYWAAEVGQIGWTLTQGLTLIGGPTCLRPSQNPQSCGSGIASSQIIRGCWGQCHCIGF